MNMRRVRSIERTRWKGIYELEDLDGFELPGVRTRKLCKTGNASGGQWSCHTVGWPYRTDQLDCDKF